MGIFKKSALPKLPAATVIGKVSKALLPKHASAPEPKPEEPEDADDADDEEADDADADTEDVEKSLADLEAMMDEHDADWDDEDVVETDEEDEDSESVEKANKPVKYKARFRRGNRWRYVYENKKTGGLNAKHLPGKDHKFAKGEAIHTGDKMHRVKHATDTHVTTVDEHGNEHTHTHDELRDKAHSGNKAAIEKHKQHGHESRKAALAKAKEIGSQKHIDRAEKELQKFKDAHGIEDEKPVASEPTPAPTPEAASAPTPEPTPESTPEKPARKETYKQGADRLHRALKEAAKSGDHDKIAEALAEIDKHRTTPTPEVLEQAEKDYERSQRQIESLRKHGDDEQADRLERAFSKESYIKDGMRKLAHPTSDAGKKAAAEEEQIRKQHKREVDKRAAEAHMDELAAASNQKAAVFDKANNALGDMDAAGDTADNPSEERIKAEVKLLQAAHELNTASRKTDAAKQSVRQYISRRGEHRAYSQSPTVSPDEVTVSDHAIERVISDKKGALQNFAHEIKAARAKARDEKAKVQAAKEDREMADRYAKSMDTRLHVATALDNAMTPLLMRKHAGEDTGQYEAAKQKADKIKKYVNSLPPLHEDHEMIQTAIGAAKQHGSPQAWAMLADRLHKHVQDREQERDQHANTIDAPPKLNKGALPPASR